QEPAQCAGRRAAVAAAPGANPARSGGLAGQRGKNQGVRTPTDPYVTAERASVRQKTEPTTRESSSRTPATGGGFGLYAQRRNTRLFREITGYGHLHPDRLATASSPTATAGDPRRASVPPRSGSP